MHRRVAPPLICKQGDLKQSRANIVTLHREINMFCNTRLMHKNALQLYVLLLLN